MGSLSKFLGSPKEIEINGEKLTINPIKVKDMELFSKQNPTETEVKEMGKKIIKLSIPDATDEEIDSLSMDAFIKIMDEINKLNGFKNEALESIKGKIAKSKQQ